MVKIRTDSKSIALLAIFSAMVAMLEIFPIIGITDLKFFPGGTPFTLDWTGIPLVIVFAGLGFVFSVVSTGVMFIAIGYRNFPGAVFKGAAEILTLLGLFAAMIVVKRTQVGKRGQLLLYLIYGATFRAMGMYFINIQLLPIFYPAFYTFEAAVIASTVLIPWNVLQAVVNIVGGFFLFYMIPENLRIQAGMQGDVDEAPIGELTKEEVEGGSENASQ